MIFIYCNWGSTRWQWSVDLYKNRKQTVQKEKQRTKQYKNNEKHTIHKTEKNAKQKIIIKILKNLSRIFLKIDRNIYFLILVLD